MGRTLSSLAALLLGAGIMMAGNSLLGIVLPLKMDAAGFSTEMVGLVMAAYFGGLLAGSIYGKRLIGEVGHIRAFAGFAAIIAAVTLAYPMVFNAVSWAILRFVGGFCIAGLFAAMESWLNERSDNAIRGQVLSIYMAVNYMAIMAGQLMINLWDVGAVDGFIMAALLTSLSLVPVVLTRVQAPSLEDIEPLAFRALYRASPLAVVGSGIAGMVMGSYYAMGAVFADSQGFEVFEVSLFMSSVILGGMVLQWPIGRVSDRFDRRTVLLCVLCVAALACAGGVAATVARVPLPVFLGLGVVMGGAMTTIYPICVAQAFDYLPRSRYVAASSGLMLAYALGATAGPVTSAFAMGALGPVALFGFIGTVAALFAAFVVYRMAARRPLPAAEQEPVVSMPRMSPVCAELDPRALELELEEAE